jgi:hypothetical protein
MKHQDFEYKEPETYEEAVQVLKQIPHDNITRGAIRAVWIRAGIVTAIGAAAALIFGIKGAPAYLIKTIAGVSVLMGALTSLPIVGILLQNHEINSGTVFTKMNEEQTIDAAKHYVRTYNEDMTKKKRKKRK